MSATSYPELACWIAGEWLRGSDRDHMPVLCPATGAEIARLPLATAADIDRAIGAAAAAFASWRDTTALERGRILAKIAHLMRRDVDALAFALTTDQGKTLREAQGEVTSAADTFEWMAEEGKRAYGRVVPARFPGADQFVFLEPVGPVAAFAPWNYPLALSCRKIATALAAGCTVVIKPAEETPGALVLLGRICEEAGLPAGVLNIVFGHPAQVSRQLICDARIKKISFTGSGPVGRQLAVLAGEQMKKITLELGGHAPVIIMPDIDVEKVAAMSIAAKFRNAGQICFSPTRYFVHAEIYARFVDAFAAQAQAIRVGNGVDPEAQMGPLANARRLTAMDQMVSDAVQQGGRVACGGRAGPAEGFFWQPTLIADAPDDALVFRQEAFGPLAACAPFTDLAQVLERANRSVYGLGAYAFTADAKAARLIRRRIEAGSLSINTYALSPPELPFGGVKESGTGSELGQEGLAEHLQAKAVIWADAP